MDEWSRAEKLRRNAELALMAQLQRERNAIPKEIHLVKAEMTELARKCLEKEQKRLIAHIQTGLAKGKAKRDSL